MKFARVCLVALVAASALVAVSASGREVRSYVSEMEYADHVDMHAGAEDLPVAEHVQTMMETASHHSDAADEEAAPHHTELKKMEPQPMHFLMEEDDAAFMELSADESDTEVARAMALEIHDAAQEHFVAEEDQPSFLEAFESSEVEAEEQDDSGLTAAELAQEAADKAAEAKDAAAEKSDNKEEAQAVVAEQADNAVLGITTDPKWASPQAIAAAENLPAATPAAAAPAATPAAAPAAAATPAAIPAAAAPAAPAAAAPAAATPAAAAPAAAAAATPSFPTDEEPFVVNVPGDNSAAYAAVISNNVAATETIKTAVGEMTSIISNKDETIRGLIANVTYLSVSVGKLASKVDLQRSYISLLKSKLALANAKVERLRDHVAASKQTTSNIRDQLKAVESRLSAQDDTSKDADAYVAANPDAPLPTLVDNLEINGLPAKEAAPAKVSPPVRRLHQRIGGLIPVEGTQTYADIHSAFPTIVYEPHSIPTGYIPAGQDGIPTIIVTREY